MAGITPVFHTASHELLLRFAKHPSHSLIISGEEGLGTLFAAHFLIEKLGISSQDIVSVEKEKDTVPIDAIKPLYRTAKTIHQTRMVILIDDADTMSEDAQNALLKLLEEPPRNVTFILTAHQQDRLLPTIRSRSMQIPLRRVTKHMSQNILAQLSVSPSVSQKILFLALGRPAEIIRLATDADYYDSQVSMVAMAKQFLESDKYQRLVQAKSVMTDRASALKFTAMLGALLEHMMYRQANDESLVESSEALTDVTEALWQNGNPRAQLLLLCERL